MKWKIQLIAEGASGEKTEAEIATIEREDLLSPSTAGLTIAEGKAILECLQKRIVAAQVEHHGVSMKVCSNCGAAARTKGHYNSILRTVYGNVPMRVRRLRACGCAFESTSRSVLFTNHNPVTPELRYLTAKLAALMPFLDVRVHVLNGSLEDAFRYWHRGFRPSPTAAEGVAAA